MNPRDAIADALTDPDVPNDTRRLIAEHEADGALALLAERGFVVVACPPGSRVVVSRTPKPCQRCDSRGTTCATKGCNGHRCSACGGSGVVEATTIHGLEPFGYRCMWEGCDTYLCDGVHYEGSKRAPVVMEVESWALVALPEETPQ